MLIRYMAVIMAFLLAAPVMAQQAKPQPVGDRDVYEREYTKCIAQGFADSCFITVFAGHFYAPPRNTALVYKAMMAKMSGVKVVKVHPIQKRVTANLVDVRTYLLELKDGSFMGFYIMFRRMGSGWYIVEFGLEKDDDFIRSILGVPIMRP